MENELFDLAVAAALRVPPKNVIGTKSEQVVHYALKYYFQCDDRFHEQKVDGFICDATDESGNEIIEIQTRAFDRLRKKLERLLASHPITVVYPVIAKKRVIVTYEKSGECSVRISPKKGKPSDIFGELYKIKEFIPNKNLKIKIAVICADEHRLYSGTKSERRPFQKPISVERTPTELIEVSELVFPHGYASILPAELPEQFNSSDLAHLKSISVSSAGYILHLMSDLNIVTRVDRNKKGYVYKRN